MKKLVLLLVMLLGMSVVAQAEEAIGVFTWENPYVGTDRENQVTFNMYCEGGLWVTVTKINPLPVEIQPYEQPFEVDNEYTCYLTTVTKDANLFESVPSVSVDFFVPLTAKNFRVKFKKKQ